jgi:hypothetical protein
VRDRDRIRQEVLERLGWNIYRVWSTDWFNDPARETVKLIAWLDELRDRYEAKFERANQAVEALNAPPAIAPEPEVEAEAEPPTAVTETTAAERAAPPPALVLRPPPGRKVSVNQGEMFSVASGAPERPQITEESAQQPRGPTGKRHVIDGIEFYESMNGYYEVWHGGQEAGTVERVQSGGAAPARVYGGTFRAQKPAFLATRAWDEATFVTDDIYVAVRRLAREYAEHLGEEVG